MSRVGVHFICDMFGLHKQGKFLDEVDELGLMQILIDGGLKPLQHNGNQFVPEGYSYFVFLQESHFSIHTYPDKDIATFDLYACDADSEKIRKIGHTIRKRFDPSYFTGKMIDRGVKST